MYKDELKDLTKDHKEQLQHLSFKQLSKFVKL